MVSLGLGLGFPMPSRGAPGEAGYIAPAVHFDTSTHLSIASISCLSNTNFSWSMWIKRPGAQVYTFFGDASGAGTPSSPWSSGTTLSTELYGEGGGEGPFTVTMPDPLVQDEWHHVLWSISTNGTEGNKVAKCFLDDVEVTLVVDQDTGGPFNIQCNGFDFRINGASAGSRTAFDVADLWIAPGITLLSGGTIPEANRRKFISDTGKPVDPSNFPAAPMIFSGDATSFGTNQGTGGAFTTTGALTNASTSPSS